ncbi:hypothetical protein HDV05_000516 [Chytridiales sp. JEL 0842]|nr:hypothetical protein HDV05_000516 [Chytridiales sp. JEL 0842]
MRVVHLLATILGTLCTLATSAAVPPRTRFRIQDILGLTEGPTPPPTAQPEPLPKDHTLLFILNSLPQTSSLAALVNSHPSVAQLLNSTTTKYTVFAPSNEALEHAPDMPPEIVSPVLLYHVASSPLKAGELKTGDLVDTMLVLESLGKPQKIKVTSTVHDEIILNGRTSIVKPNIPASNGVIHLVNNVMRPPPNISRLLLFKPQEFSLLMLALRRANLWDAVKDGVGITLFAPTNRAFRRLGFARLRYLFSDAGSQDLKKTLLYHVSPQLLYTPAILKSKELSIPTLQGAKLELKVEREEDEYGHSHEIVEVNGHAHVVAGDILGGNGVVHGLDRVVFLPGEDLEESELKRVSDEELVEILGRV